MNRLYFILLTVVLVLISFRSANDIVFVMCLISFIGAIYKRCDYVGIHSISTKVGIILTHFMPLLNIPVYIWLLLLARGAYEDEPVMLDDKPNFIKKLYLNLKVFWVLAFSLLSIVQMFFLVPYTTHLPSSLVKNDKAGWNSYNGYGTFSYKPQEIPKKYNQYTDINYQKLALQETILGIACIAGYAITFTIKK